MKIPIVCLAVLALPLAVLGGSAASGPNDFRGRIAWSGDGNHNDPDDWISSPVALAIFAEAGVKDRLVHFDYNSILSRMNAEWERTHAESVLGAAERYGYDKSLFHDCRRNREAAVASIAKAVERSSADNPLYLIIAGPMEVPRLCGAQGALIWSALACLRFMPELFRSG